MIKYRWQLDPSDFLPDDPAYSLEAHLKLVQDLHARYSLNNEKACQDHAVKLLQEIVGSRPPWMVVSAMGDCIEQILTQNDIYLTNKPTLAYAPYLQRMQARLSSVDCLHAAEKAIRGFFEQLIPLLPDSAFEDARDISDEICVPVYALTQHSDKLASLVHAHFLSVKYGADDHAFRDLTNKLVENLARVSGVDLKSDTKRKLIYPPESDLTAEERIERYLQNTPFIDLFYDPVPFTISRKAYGEHAAIFAPSGHGKTQLLQNLITGFLNEPDPPGMFILDSQGDMLRKIEHLELFAGKLKDRLVILDPEDAEPPALNFFQLGNRADVFDAQLNELFNYLFTAIDSELTAKQGTAVTYLLKLMRAIPAATIETLKDVMEEQVKGLDASRYADAIGKLDRITQDFFRNQFFDKAAMGGTRQQVARRLYTILGNPIFIRMFGAKENRFNALKAIRDKKIVLINTSQRFLGQDASAVFGRFMIAQCLAAAYERADDPESNRHLTLLIVDEASEYFDAKTERILSQARKYGFGLLFATQYLEQMPPQVKAAVNGNTTIKLAGPVSYNDAMMFSREMYTTGEFIRSMRKTNEETQFACHVRGMTPHAIALTIPFGTLEKQATMGLPTWNVMREANRLQYGSSSLPAPLATGTPPPPDDSDEFADHY